MTKVKTGKLPAIGNALLRVLSPHCENPAMPKKTARRGRPLAFGRQDGGMMLRAHMVVALFHRARARRLCDREAKNRTIHEFKDWFPDARISLSEINRILAHYQPPGRTAKSRAIEEMRGHLRLKYPDISPAKIDQVRIKRCGLEDVWLFEFREFDYETAKKLGILHPGYERGKTVQIVASRVGPRPIYSRPSRRPFHFGSG